MKAALYAIFFLACYAFVGTLDFNDKASAAAERAAPKVASPDEARIWSQRCTRQGKQVLASQADGGKWKLRCVSADLKV